VRHQVPPYQPNFDGPDDTSNFDISDIKPINNPIASLSSNKDTNIELSFVGFTSTFTGGAMINENKQTFPNLIEKENEPLSPKYVEPIVADSDAKVSETISLLESRLKAANQEWSEMSSLLSDMKKEKNTLSDKLRIKEEELDEQIEKNSQLRTQIRNHEKYKRQYIEEVNNLQAEVTTLRIIRKQGLVNSWLFL